MNKNRFGQDQNPAAVPDPLAVLMKIARELEKMEPGDAARIADTLATWFGGGDEDDG